MGPFLSKSWYNKERIEQVTKEAGWKDVKFVRKEAYLNLVTDLRPWVSIAWTFLGTPVGRWQQRDEDKWKGVLGLTVDGIGGNEWFRIEDGVSKTRMVADVAIVKK
jgi:hypothetical protein